MPKFCKWLVLVPTAMERAYVVADQLQMARVENCGFGPVIAAARTAALIERLCPEKILLGGIAGRLSKDLRIGNAYQFKRVRCHGVGVGNGPAFLTAEEIGWSQWSGSDTQIGVELPLDLEPEPCQGLSHSDLLVTVCSASADQADAMNLKKRYPHACAEDMEGFSVAAAAALAGLPITIVRGVSNDAGDRNHENWQIAEAMRSVNTMLVEIIGSDP